jgi:hypothetical protein
MTTPNEPNQEPVFQTPNPEALKEAAQRDPIHQREDAQETDLSDPKLNSDQEAEQMGREASVDLANSQTAIANLGGH